MAQTVRRPVPVLIAVRGLMVSGAPGVIGRMARGHTVRGHILAIHHIILWERNASPILWRVLEILAVPPAETPHGTAAAGCIPVAIKTVPKAVLRMVIHTITAALGAPVVRWTPTTGATGDITTITASLVFVRLRASGLLMCYIHVRPGISVRGVNMTPDILAIPGLIRVRRDIHPTKVQAVGMTVTGI